MATLGGTLSTDQALYPGTLGAAPASSAYGEGGPALGGVLSTVTYPPPDYLDPNGDVTNQWTKSAGADSYPLVDDAVRQPTAPTTGSDRLTSATTGQVTEVALETVTKKATITSVKAWWHGAGTSGMTVSLALYTGASQLATADVTDAIEQWHSVAYAGDLTQAQLDDLRIRVTLT